MWDAIIAGAGPAGAVVAHELARRGHRVLLTDDVDPAAPKIGEALPGAAVRLLRSIGLPAPSPDGPHLPVMGNLSSWDCDQLVASDFIRDPDGPGWRLDRASFDAELRAAAVRAGADFHSARVTDVARKDLKWNIRFKNGGTEPARWIVDATGRRASIARRLGARRLRDAPLVGVYARGTPATDLPLNRTVIEATPRGWWYAARLPSGMALAGFHTHRRDAMRLLADPEAWRDALADTRHVGRMLAGTSFERPRSLEAGGARLDRYSGNEWIACGDAALSFDPISGQGIFSALYGGLKAGSAIDDALTGARTSQREYSKRLDKIRQVYAVRRRAVYQGERRWSGPFWSEPGEESERSKGTGRHAPARSG
jgi:flavin-dependent dehydrogenase